MDGNEEDIMEIYCKKGYIKREALRPLRTNSVRENFKQSKPDLERGYPLMLVQEKLTAVNFTNRNEAFATKQTKEILPFVTTYNLGKNYLRKCFH